MGIGPVRFFHGAITAVAGGASAQTLFTRTATVAGTAGASTDTHTITSIVICNTNATTTVNCTLSLVPNSGGAAGIEAQANRILSALPIPANGIIALNDVRMLVNAVRFVAGDTIQAFASSGSQLNIFITGVYET